jgi:DNA polymerase-3 subunit alpha
VENLIRAGAFDGMGYNRKQLMSVCSKVVDDAQAAMRDNIAGQIDLFGGFGDDPAETAVMQRHEIPDMPEYSRQELMAMERETTGLFLSGHPMDAYRAAAKHAGAVSIAAINEDFAREDGPQTFYDGQRIAIAGIVTASKTKTTRNNSLMAYVTVEDDTSSIELLCFSRTLQTCGSYLAENQCILVKGKLSVRDEKAPQILCDSAYPLTNNGTIPAEAEPKEEKLPAAQAIFLRMPGMEDPRFRHLQLVLQMFPGDTPLKVRMLDTGKLLGTKCLLHPSLIRELKEVFGEENVVVK